MSKYLGHNVYVASYMNGIVLTTDAPWNAASRIGMAAASNTIAIDIKCLSALRRYIDKAHGRELRQLDSKPQQQQQKKRRIKKKP